MSGESDTEENESDEMNVSNSEALRHGRNFEVSNWSLAVGFNKAGAGTEGSDADWIPENPPSFYSRMCIRAITTRVTNYFSKIWNFGINQNNIFFI